MSRVGALVLLVVALTGAARADGPASGAPHPLDILGKPLAPIQPPETRDESGFDCIDVALDLTLDFDTRTIRGSARHTLRATRPLDLLQLNLTDSLQVLAVWRGAIPAPYVHRYDAVTITLDPPLAEDERAEITIAYRGRPPRDGFLGFAFQNRNGVPAAYSLSEPKSAHVWWPCKDLPSDKLLATIRLDIPDTLYAGSNGRLVSDEPSGPGRRRMTWREDHPIAPYLISVACTNYSIFGDEHHGPQGQVLPILYLAYPEHREWAEGSWARTPAMIGAFEDRFGPYPFYGEKYGMAEFSWGGGMEHQTLTSYGEYLVDGTDTNDWVVAHELAHQWWGDDVTCARWEDIWLNEGFASFSEAIWEESIGGIEAYRTWIRRMWWPDFPGRIVPPNYMFNGTVYFKGAWVLHMLRGLLGDDAFFGGLREYRRRHHYGGATTEDLITAMQNAGGRDLRWFFDEWVYGSGQPMYMVTWRSEPRPEGPWIRVRVEQTQADPVFRMPLEIEVRDSIGSYREVVGDSLRVQEFAFRVRLAPDDVRLDPDDWVLKQSIGGSDAPSPAAGAVRLLLGPARPSPGLPPIHIPLLGSTVAAVDIFSVTGQRVSRILPSRPATEVVWNGRDSAGRPVPGGLYLVRAVEGGAPIRVWLLP